MKAMRWNDVRGALRRVPAPTPLPAATFWEAFEAHRRLRPAPGAATALARRLPSPWLLSAAGACAALVVVASGLFARARGPSATTVQSYDVTERHAAVLLLTDERSHATILWVAGLDPDDETIPDDMDDPEDT